MKKLIWIILMLLPLVTKAPHISKEQFDDNIEYQEMLLKKRENNENLHKFLLRLRTVESSNKWKIINKYGYMGYYQFGNSALQTIGYGYITSKEFKKNPNIFPPKLQHKAVKKLLLYNSKRLQNYYKYIGCTINGICITESGLLAAAHLGGAGNVIKFLNSNGKIDFADAYGTKISKYLKEFNNYKIKI